MDAGSTVPACSSNSAAGWPGECARPTVALHLGALGDLVLALPALERLRQSGPVVLLAQPAIGRLLVASGAVAAAVDGTQAALAPLFAGSARALPGWLTAALATARRAVLFVREGAALQAGFASAGAREVLVVPPRPEPGSGVHAADALVRGLARALGEPAPAEPARPVLAACPAGLAAARALLGERGLAPGAYVALHPGSGGLRKCWPPASWIELGRALAAAGGPPPLVLLGPVELQARPELGAALAAAGLPVIEAPPLETLAGLLAQAAAYAGHDSGPTHLAAALGTPTLALFGPTDPALWAPRGPRPERIRVLRAGCEVQALAPPAALAALRALLGAGGCTPASPGERRG